MKAYTGVGSRSTPVWCRFFMEDVASAMANDKYVLRSGSAQGADSAFELGCDKVCGAGNIYVPWGGFGTGKANMFKDYHILTGKQFETAREFLLEKKIIPHFDNMKEPAQKLHARNYLQVVGHWDKIIPSKVLFYFAEHDWVTGEPLGGTRTAVLLGQEFDIPCYNLREEKVFNKLAKRLDLQNQQFYIDTQDERLNKGVH